MHAQAAAFLPGLFLGLSLIIAIGAQNAFVLRQGLAQKHVFAVCLVCAGSDAALICAGVAGCGQLIAQLPWLEPVMRFGGAAFLLLYAARALRSALRNTSALTPLSGETDSLRKTLAVTLGFTWLNPHVYLDTVILLGAVSTQYAGRKPAFALGAMLGSAGFFFALGYGARFLKPVFSTPIAWRLLDLFIACSMAAIAWNLVR
jgi:L-lysine exporter family protein LysE/ArgO